jgi:hypothetical protein
MYHSTTTTIQNRRGDDASVNIKKKIEFRYLSTFLMFYNFFFIPIDPYI